MHLTSVLRLAQELLSHYSLGKDSQNPGTIHASCLEEWWLKCASETTFEMHFLYMGIVSPYPAISPNTPVRNGCEFLSDKNHLKIRDFKNFEIHAIATELWKCWVILSQNSFLHLMESLFTHPLAKEQVFFQSLLTLTRPWPCPPLTSASTIWASPAVYKPSSWLPCVLGPACLAVLVQILP